MLVTVILRRIHGGSNIKYCSCVCIMVHSACQYAEHSYIYDCVKKSYCNFLYSKFHTCTVTCSTSFDLVERRICGMQISYSVPLTCAVSALFRI
jgi:hypothetical protein